MPWPRPHVLRLDDEERTYLQTLLEDPFTYAERVATDNPDAEQQRLEEMRGTLLNRVEQLP